MARACGIATGSCATTVAPAPSSASISVSAGDSRMSSVWGLNASPQTAMRDPDRAPSSAVRSFSNMTCFWRSLACLGRLEDAEARRARRRCAGAPSRPSESTSRRSRDPERGTTVRCARRSRCPSDVSTLAPTRSQSSRHLVHERDARGEHGVGRVLRHLGGRDVHEHDRLAGAHEGAYSSAMMLRAWSLSTPSTTRSGFMKSSTASPSFRNSGLLQTCGTGTGVPPDRLGHECGGADRDGDLVTTTSSWACRPTVSAAASTWRRSAEPSSPGGVPTAMKITDACAAAIAEATSVVNAGVPPPGCGDQRLQAGLVDRQDVLLQAVDLAGVDVGADDVVARLGEAGADDEADVAGADDRDSHDESC
jgi:hypothetical protein